MQRLTIAMSDNGVKAEDAQVKTRDEAGDDEVRAWPSHYHSSPQLVHDRDARCAMLRDESRMKHMARVGADKIMCRKR